MSFPCKLAAIACGALGLSTPALPAHAGEGVNSSEAYLILSNVMVVASAAAPIALSKMGVDALSEVATGSSSQAPPPRRGATDEVPDMEVKEVGQDEHGNPQVHLQDPATPDSRMTLIWQGRGETPTAGFQKGQMITFQPSPHASGWLLRDDKGSALAFIPTQGAAREHRPSAQF